MLSTMLRCACWAAAAASLGLAAAAPAAEAFPSRPIRMIVPFSPGGAADTPGRIMAQKLSETIGQQVVVDNRPGAGSTIGADIAARSAPDGYTLLYISNTHVISASLYKKLPYDPLNDFAPMMQVGAAPNALVVNPALPAKSVKELIALAKAQPGKIDYASSGNGSSQHLFGALFVSMAGINMNHVPYRGSGPATADLISGQVKVGFPGIAIALPHQKAGRLRILAVTSAKRSAQAPDIPSIAEAGVPGYDATLWLGLVAPKGTPRKIIDKIDAEVAKALQMADVRGRIAATGTDIITSSPEEFGKFIRAEYEKWGKVVRAVGAQVN